jgi:hypothetical protein
MGPKPHFGQMMMPILSFFNFPQGKQAKTITYHPEMSKKNLAGSWIYHSYLAPGENRFKART